jgi:DNA-binding GntR family transcriptional regulator
MSVSSTEAPQISLLKENLAAALRQAILDGRLAPGDRVVEGRWAREFGAAQASVREAINLLIADGFLIKDAGRSARVVVYREKDIVDIYEVRAAIEGLAAQLACSNGADLSHMEAALDVMSSAVEKRAMKALIQSDLEFHLALMQASGNPLLADLGRKLLFPLFAFIQMKVLKSRQGPEAWLADLEYHRLILQVIRECNPALANEFVQHCIAPNALDLSLIHSTSANRKMKQSKNDVVLGIEEYYYLRALSSHRATPESVVAESNFLSAARVVAIPRCARSPSDRFCVPVM